MRNRCFFILLIFIFLYSCKKKDSAYIIPRDTFKEILIDIHLADGIYMMNYGKYFVHTDSVNYYSSIFKSYGYTRAHFDSTLKFYAANPMKFDIIYGKVINRLNILEQQILQTRDFENNSQENLYKGKTKWNLPVNSKSTRIPFDIAISDSAEYTINVYARKYANDGSKNLRITAFFYYMDSTTGKWKMDEFPEVSYTNDRFYNLFSTSKQYDSKQKARLRGWILNHDKQSELFKKHIDIKMIYVEKKLLIPKKIVAPKKKSPPLKKIAPKK